MAGQLERLKTAVADRCPLEREFGRGEMATVYLAQDLKHDRPVALRLPSPTSPPAEELLTEMSRPLFELAASLGIPEERVLSAIERWYPSVESQLAALKAQGAVATTRGSCS